MEKFSDKIKIEQFDNGITIKSDYHEAAVVALCSCINEQIGKMIWAAATDAMNATPGNKVTLTIKYETE